MLISSFCYRLLIWVLISFPSLLVSCIFSFILLCVAFISSFILWPRSVNSVNILLTSALTSASDRLAIASLVSSFSGALISFSFILAHLLCLRGGALGIRQGRATLFAALWSCMWGRSQRRNNVACSVLIPLSVTSLASQKWFVPFRCYLQVGGFVLILGPCVSVLWGWGILPLPLSPQIFSLNCGFKSLAASTETLDFVVGLSAPLSPRLVYTPMWDCLCSLPAATLLHPLRPAAHSGPPTSGWMFLQFLGWWTYMQMLFWQFWLFFVFKLVVFLLLVVRGSEAFLPIPPFWSLPLNVGFSKWFHLVPPLLSSPLIFTPFVISSSLWLKILSTTW